MVSIHYPEFAHEREVENVAAAVAELAITYPVGIDNERRTWGAYNQRFWPTTYLIDKTGNIRVRHIGEFNEQSAAEFRATVDQLLAE